MPDGNRFAGLSDALGDEAERESEAVERDETDRPAETVGDDEATDSEATDGETVEEGSDSGPVASASTDEEGGPAFSFEETTPKSVYVRDETLDALEDLEFEVEAALRREYGVRDVTGREFHDALVRVAAEHADDIAALVVETRDR
ncbi:MULTISPECIES: hypothetical protein [Haloprofundus]|uniref:hypothetical protein n=1 Tax=Haloprofundus TaxID=1911573 RepID=UPI000E44DB74|nr:MULTISPECIES: hypothetical protein [Haloprofundus]QCJ46712.1 hypothetical protein FCF25_06085 [Haloprofundus sp. MHR1]